MTNLESSPSRLYSRRQAELLAAEIFQTKLRSTQRHRSKAKQNNKGKNFTRCRAEELAAEIFGRKTNFRRERRLARRRKRLAEKRRGQEQARCCDWILHTGNIHYARNGSSFTYYTRLTPTRSENIGLGDHGAIGIGTVNLVVPRAYGAPDFCTITLRDVLHIPGMICNGLSISRLTNAGTEVLQGDNRTVVTHGRAGAQLFEARKMIGNLHRVCLLGEPQASSPLLESTDDPPFPISLRASEAVVELLGRSSRELRGEECEIRTISGEAHGVTC